MSPRQRERASQILVEALLVVGVIPGQADEQVGKKHGVSARQIRRWRKALGSDPELAELVRSKKALAEQGWAEQLPGAIRACIDFVFRAAGSANIKDPQAIHSMVGALKILTDVETTRRMVDARLRKQEEAAAAQAQGQGAPVIDLASRKRSGVMGA